MRGIPERDGITSQGGRLMQGITASSVQSQHSLNYYWIFFGIPIVLTYNFHSSAYSFNDEREVESNSAIMI